MIPKRLNTFLIVNMSVMGVVCAYASDYVTKSGDTLSTLAHHMVPGQVWGPQGSLARMLAVNPDLKDPNLIFPGQRIQIPEVSSLANNDQKFARLPAAENVTDRSTSPQTAPTAPASLLPGSDAPGLLNASTPDDLGQHLSLILSYRFKTFNAQDAVNSSQAKLFTSSDVKFDAAWAQDWNQTLSTFFQFSFEKIDFEPSSNASKPLMNTAQSPAHLTLGADLHASSRLVLRTTARYGQELFTGSESGSIALDSVFIPAFSEQAIFRIYSRGRTDLGIEGGASYLLGATANNYSVNAGYAVNGALFLNQNFGPKNKSTLALIVGYENTQQNTSLVNQSVGDGFAKIMFSMPIFGGDK